MKASTIALQDQSHAALRAERDEIEVIAEHGPLTERQNMICQMLACIAIGDMIMRDAEVKELGHG